MDGASTIGLTSKSRPHVCVSVIAARPIRVVHGILFRTHAHRRTAFAAVLLLCVAAACADVSVDNDGDSQWWMLQFVRSTTNICT